MRPPPVRHEHDLHLMAELDILSDAEDLFEALCVGFEQFDADHGRVSTPAEKNTPFRNEQHFSDHE